jgi:hypothetical protein
MAEAEAIHRTYLSHEASIKSIGSLHYVGAILGVIGFGVAVFSALSQNGEMGEGAGSAQFVVAAAYFMVMALINTSGCPPDLTGFAALTYSHMESRTRSASIVHYEPTRANSCDWTN